MNDLSKEKTMTIKELSEIFNYDESTIRKIGKELFPDIFQNGKTTYLNEMQVTAIKFKLGKNSELVKTDIEMSLRIIEAARYFENKYNDLKKENEILKPKAEYYDKLVERDLLTNLRDTARQVGLTQNNFIKKLLDDNYIYKNIHGKYRSSCNSFCNGLFALKDFVNNSGYKDKQLLITVEGKKHFLNKYGVK